MTYQKKLIVTLLLLGLFTTPFFTTVYAEETNVLDCIENEDDCEELEEQKLKEVEKEEAKEDPLLVGEDSFKASTLFFNIIKMLVALLFILGLIYAILLFLRKRNKLLQNNHLLENMGGISLGRDQSIQLIRIGSRIYVVGVGEHVDLMLEITDQEVLEALLSEEEVEEENFLQTILGRTKEKQKQSFLTQLQSELDKLQENRQSLVRKKMKKDDEHE